MTQVDSSRVFNASSDAVWQVVADPARLAEWVPTTRIAQRADAEEVHLEGESHGHPYAITSPFHAEPAHRRLDWSGERVPGYAGSLLVIDRDGSAEVQIHLTIPDDKLPPSDEVIAEIRRGTEEALDRLANARHLLPRTRSRARPSVNQQHHAGRLAERGAATPQLLAGQQSICRRSRVMMGA